MEEQMVIEIPKEVENLQLPDPQLLLEYKNLKDRILYLDIEVGMDAYELGKQIIRWNVEDKDIPPDERKPIKLAIWNYGGNADVMFFLFDCIKASKTKVIAYNLGVCASAAFWIFISCHEKYMFKNGTVVIHDGNAELSNSGNKLLDNAKEYKKTLDKLQDLILENTKIPKATLTKKWRDEWSLSSDECLKYGICDKIVESLDELA
jgi:ATP-dependent Clp protease, protease subunit